MLRLRSALTAGAVVLALCPVVLSPALSHSVAHAATECSGTGCDYQNPSTAGCTSNTYYVTADILDGGGNKQGTVYMLPSPSTNHCGAYYAYTYSWIYTNGVEADVHRGGAEAGLFTPYNPPQMGVTSTSPLLGENGTPINACGTVYNSSGSQSWSNCTVSKT